MTMNLTQSIKQTWYDARQRPAFTALYVCGVALAVAFTMIFAMIYYVKLAPVYPERNRPRTLYINSVQCKMNAGRSQFSSPVGYPFFRDYISKLENAETISGCPGIYGARSMVRPDNGQPEFEINDKGVDPAFFKIYDFKFLHGKPFTEADLSSASQVCIIGHHLAERLFGSPESAMGRDIHLNDLDFRVAGVVREGSRLTPASFAQLYRPYTTIDGYDRIMRDDMPWVGVINATLTVKDDAQAEALRSEIDDMLRRINAADTSKVISMKSYPMSHTQSAFMTFGDTTDWRLAIIKKYSLILLVLLIVPAINLGGMIAGRMEERLSEMGIRKSYGASRRRLLGQVLAENLYMTLAGGLLGLLAAWTTIYAGREWIFGVFDPYHIISTAEVSSQVSGEMVFAPLVFAIALTICMVLNLLSALIPAWWSLRRPIVSSINEKR